MSDIENEESEIRSFGSKFLSGLDVTSDKDGGVLKTILRHGIGDDHPLNGDTVYFHYMGHFEDGSIFDSSRTSSEKHQFIMGNGDAIKAWEIGIHTMRRNEVAIFYCKPNYAYGKFGKSSKIPPNATLVFEIELFSWRGEDVSTNKDGGVLKSRITEGTGNPPKEGAICEINLIGWHEGRKFRDAESKFTLGEGCEISIVDGVEMALKSMKSGEKASLKVKSRYGYGSEGHERYAVPPNADLEFEVHLKSYFPFKEGWMMDDEERIGEAAKMKMKGTKCFREGKFKFAAKHYTRIIEFLIEEDNLRGKEAAQRQFLMLAAYLNIALCHLKLGNNLEATHACDEALKMDSKNEKAYYRRAMAHMELANYEEAIKDFKSVLEINPDNKVAEEKIEAANEHIKEVKKREKNMYSQMFKKRVDKETAKNVSNMAHRSDEKSNKNVSDMAHRSNENSNNSSNAQDASGVHQSKTENKTVDFQMDNSVTDTTVTEPSTDS